MVENVIQVIESRDGWMVSSTESLRVAQILDSVAKL